MKKFLAALPAAAALAVLLLMAGCGARDDKLVGRWVWEENPAFVTTFNADGTGTHNISWGHGTAFQWTTPGNSIRWNYPGYSNMDTPYHLSGDVLYIFFAGGIRLRYIRDW